MTLHQHETRCGQRSDVGFSGTFAYAVACQRDHLDRPVLGRINICPEALSTDSAEIAAQTGVVLHELFHALGFTADSWPLFRDPDDGMAPRTPRGPSQYTWSTPPAAEYRRQLSCAGQAISFFEPGETTTQFTQERGSAACAKRTSASYADPSQCVQRIVTRRARDAARAHFGCPTLLGPELENQPTSACAPMGSHWEQRYVTRGRPDRTGP